LRHLSRPRETTAAPSSRQSSRRHVRLSTAGQSTVGMTAVLDRAQNRLAMLKLEQRVRYLLGYGRGMRNAAPSRLRSLAVHVRCAHPLRVALASITPFLQETRRSPRQRVTAAYKVSAALRCYWHVGKTGTFSRKSRISAPCLLGMQAGPAPPAGYSVLVRMQRLKSPWPFTQSELQQDKSGGLPCHRRITNPDSQTRPATASFTRWPAKFKRRSKKLAIT
jgi:hypothetical protein